MRATGPFEVKLAPLTASDALPGRMSIDKQFHGDLEATSKGEMMMVGTASMKSRGSRTAHEEKHDLRGLAAPSNREVVGHHVGPRRYVTIRPKAGLRPRPTARSRRASSCP